MQVQKLREQEVFLADRIDRLKSSMQEVEQNLNTDNIEQKAEELRTLEVQLNLTEKALQNTQNKLSERKQLEGSKVFKDKEKQAEELRREAQKETSEVYRTLQVLLKQTEAIHDKLRNYDKLTTELTGEPLLLSTAQSVQPFAWLGSVHVSIRNLLYSTTWLKDKLN